MQSNFVSVSLLVLLVNKYALISGGIIARGSWDQKSVAVEGLLFLMSCTIMLVVASSQCFNIIWFPNIFLYGLAALSKLPLLCLPLSLSTMSAA